MRNPKQTFSEGAGEKDAGGDRRRRRGRGEERDGWWPAAGTGGRRRGRQGQATADGGGRTPWAEQPPAEQPPTGPLAFPSPGRPLPPPPAPAPPPPPGLNALAWPLPRPGDRSARCSHPRVQNGPDRGKLRHTGSGRTGTKETRTQHFRTDRIGGNQDTPVQN